MKKADQEFILHVVIRFLQTLQVSVYGMPQMESTNQTV